MPVDEGELADSEIYEEEEGDEDEEVEEDRE